MTSRTDKFSFDIEFQWSIIKYTLVDKEGFKALPLYKETYFDLIEQQVIVKAIKRFYRKKGRLPQDIGLAEELRQLFKTKDYINNLTPTDKTNIVKKAKSLYKGVVKDRDIILEGCIQFASYVEFKKTMEEVDITDFNQYTTYLRKFQKAINTGVEIKRDNIAFAVKGSRSRQMKRKMQEQVFPTPFWQINRITNGGGYTKASIIIIIDKGKGGKTKILINIAKGYMRMRKTVLYVDLENGVDNLQIRLDQSTTKKTKREILSGEYDEKLNKIYRKYGRLGGEVIFIRKPGLTTTFDDIQAEYDRLRNEEGITCDLCIVDYVGNMGCRDGDKDDNGRISKAFIEAKNFAEFNGFEALYTGHHTIRDAAKRRATKYEPNDTAKCIDVHRHMDAMFGVNQSPEEEAAGIIRLEVVDQRDGTSDGRAYFWDDNTTQWIGEFNKAQVKEYEMGDHVQEKPKFKRVKPKNQDDLMDYEENN